jgi:ABC-2 type transport system ATP-binding protein
MNVPGGSIYGLVGTTGAGKTTILKLLAGVLAPDGGSALVADTPLEDEAAVKDRSIFIPDDLGWFQTRTMTEAARLFAGLYSRWDAGVYEDVAGAFGLDTGMKMSRFSKGMRKQAAFALALATKPSCLLLDEPIDGLDPIVRKMVWEQIVAAAADRGMTTLVSSHNLREMEGFCDRIGILDRGEMKLERDLDDLTSDIHKLQVSFGPAQGAGAGGGGEGQGAASGAYASLDVRVNVRHFSSVGSVDYLIVKGDRDELIRWRDEKRPLIFDLVPMTLEEVFVYELGGESDAVKSIIG